MIATSNAIAKIAAVAAGLGLVAMSFASFAPAAKAATSAELEAQIAALMAQIAALQGGSTSGASVTFTMDLTIGSTGSEVTALQNWLISKGYSIPAGATGYFGAQTQSALAAFQAANGIAPAAGYFGPITRAKVNSMGGGSMDGDDDDDDNNDGDLSGGAGSIDDADFISSLNNEEVGEDEEDVEVAGLEIEADDGSDIELTAVRLVFNEGTAGSDFEDYATEVSVWFNGEEVARVDADEFDDDNDWSRTISLDDGAVIDAGETGDLVVAVSGIGNLDSADANDTWTVEFDQVRFRDADGASVTEDTAGDIGGVTRTFSFNTFASAADIELKLAENDDDINDARTIEVDDSDDTDNVEVLSFTLEAEGDSDLEIKDFGVSVTSVGANTNAIISDLVLVIDGEEVSSAASVSAGTAVDYEFEDVDYTIAAGETVEAMLVATFNDIEAGTFDEGDTISFAIGEEQTDTTTLVDVEDETGEDLGDAEITGSVASGAFDLRSAGIMVTFIEADEEVQVADGADNDQGQFTIKFNVEAFGNTVYVGNAAAPTIVTSVPETTITSAEPMRYRVMGGATGAATTVDLADGITFSTSGGASETATAIVLQEDEDTDITLTVTRTNNSDADDSGLYQVFLQAIGWDTDDDGDWNIYDFNLEDFKTGLQSMN